MKEYYMDVTKTTTEKVGVLVKAESLEEAERKIEKNADQIDFSKDVEVETDLQCEPNLDSCNDDYTFDSDQYTVEGCQIIENDCFIRREFNEKSMC